MTLIIAYIEDNKMKMVADKCITQHYNKGEKSVDKQPKIRNIKDEYLIGYSGNCILTQDYFPMENSCEEIKWIANDFFEHCESVKDKIRAEDPKKARIIIAKDGVIFTVDETGYVRQDGSGFMCIGSGALLARAIIEYTGEIKPEKIFKTVSGILNDVSEDFIELEMEQNASGRLFKEKCPKCGGFLQVKHSDKYDDYRQCIDCYNIFK